MGKGKQKSIDTLMGVLAEAESRVSYEEEGNVLNDLDELLNVSLRKGEEPERRQLLEEYDSDLPFTGPEGIRRKLGAIGIEFFGHAYFPHYFSRPSPDFHRDLGAIWQNDVLKGRFPITRKATGEINHLEGYRRAVAVPRGHAKGTTLTFRGNTHAILYRYRHYLIVLSDGSDQAEGFPEDIRVEFEGNDLVQEDFGNLQGKTRRNSVILITTNIRVEATGSGKKVRGRKHRNWELGLLVLDDIGSDENVRTAEQRSKLSNWFNKAVSKVDDSCTDIVYTGTLLHYDNLLAHTLANTGYKSIKYRAILSFPQADDLQKEWEGIYTNLSNDSHAEDARAFLEAHKVKMLKGAEILWEEKLSYYDLMKVRIDEEEASFNSEEQDEPINPDDYLFQKEWLDYYNGAEVDFEDCNFVLYGFVGPSLGKTKHSNFSATITLAKHKGTGYIYVFDADIERRHPDRIVSDILEEKRWIRRDYGRGYKKSGCETVQFQWFLKEELIETSARAGLYLSVEEVPQAADETLRIQTMQPDAKNKYIRFNHRHKHLLGQLIQFPMGAHDDDPDTLERCRTLAKKVRRLKVIPRESLI